MFYCAYDLNIDITDLKKELISYTQNHPWTNWEDGKVVDNHFIDYKLIGDETLKFYDLFNYSFLSKVRITKTLANTEYPPHIDMHVDEKDYFPGEVVPSAIRTSTINILLNGSVDDPTNFYIDTTLQKIHHNDLTPLVSIDKRPELRKIDSHILTNDNAAIVNTGEWHGIKHTSDRWLASFMFHPIVSWRSSIQYCVDHNFIIERGAQ